MPLYQNQWGNPLYGVGPSDPNVYSQPTTSIQNRQQATNFNNIMVVPVSGQENAESYPVAIGLTVMLLDYEHKIFWLKSNDGITTKLVKHIFDVDESPKQDETVNKEESFVTKEEFNELNDKVNSLLKNLGESET